MGRTSEWSGELGVRCVGLNTFFDPAAQAVWNESHRRYETRSSTHVLLWFWLEENRRVLVITCFRRS